jgi:hypothetical protein
MPRLRARRRINEIRRKKSSTAGENNGFPAFSSRLRNLLLPEKFKPLGITKYDAKQDLVQWLRCYALSIENAGGNNDTKCLYFPFCPDQAPLTWIESLEKYSIEKWDQLKEQFTSNFTGTMGRSGTRMDLAMVKQEQGETLRKLLTQNPHPAPRTQQAKQAGLRHEQIPKRASQFFLKLTKDKAVKYQSLELAGWYQTVPYLRLKIHVR